MQPREDMVCALAYRLLVIVGRTKTKKDLCYNSERHKTPCSPSSNPRDRDDLRPTRRACYTGYVTQAIVNNLAPLLFIVFQTRYDVPLEMLGRLVLLNFATQLVTDLVAVTLVDRTGYRRPLVLAHVLLRGGAGPAGGAPSRAALAVPRTEPRGGRLRHRRRAARGAGQPRRRRAAQPAGGQGGADEPAALVLLLGPGRGRRGTTLLLAQIGPGAWQVLPLVWALVPLANLVAFLRVPLPPTVPDEHRTSLRAPLQGARLRGRDGADAVRRRRRADHVPVVLAVRRAGSRGCRRSGATSPGRACSRS